jgi:hypothetical protein
MTTVQVRTLLRVGVLVLDRDRRRDGSCVLGLLAILADGVGDRSLRDVEINSNVCAYELSKRAIGASLSVVMVGKVFAFERQSQQCCGDSHEQCSLELCRTLVAHQQLEAASAGV